MNFDTGILETLQPAMAALLGARSPLKTARAVASAASSNSFRRCYGLHFTGPRGDGWSPTEIKHIIERREPFRGHAFELACARNDIDHRLTKPKHNRQVLFV